MIKSNENLDAKPAKRSPRDLRHKKVKESSFCVPRGFVVIGWLMFIHSGVVIGWPFFHFTSLFLLIKVDDDLLWWMRDCLLRRQKELK